MFLTRPNRCSILHVWTDITLFIFLSNSPPFSSTTKLLCPSSWKINYRTQVNHRPPIRAYQPAHIQHHIRKSARRKATTRRRVSRNRRTAAALKQARKPELEEVSRASFVLYYPHYNLHRRNACSPRQEQQELDS